MISQAPGRYEPQAYQIRTYQPRAVRLPSGTVYEFDDPSQARDMSLRMAGRALGALRDRNPVKAGSYLTHAYVLSFAAYPSDTRQARWLQFILATVLLAWDKTVNP